MHVHNYTLQCMCLFDVIMLQVVGSDSDDVFYHFKEVRQYCQAACGQHIHDILDHINDALRVSCTTACHNC